MGRCRWTLAKSVSSLVDVPGAGDGGTHSLKSAGLLQGEDIAVNGATCDTELVGELRQCGVRMTHEILKNGFAPIEDALLTHICTVLQ